MHVALVPAMADQQPILANLIQLYVHDFSEHTPVTLGVDGRFAYPQLPLYWSEAGRFPLLAVTDQSWAGFILVRQESQPTHADSVFDMAEFFVLRAFRRKGIGTRLAHLAFERFPGNWQVRVMESNSAACQFWQQAIENFTGASQLPRRMRIDGMGWYTFRFVSGAER